MARAAEWIPGTNDHRATQFKWNRNTQARLEGGVVTRARKFTVPLRRCDPDGVAIEVFAREIFAAKHADAPEKLQPLLFLQGGRGAGVGFSLQRLFSLFSLGTHTHTNQQAGSLVSFLVFHLERRPGFASPAPAAPLGGWMRQAVDRDFRVVLLDQRGTGQSARTPRRLSLLRTFVS